MLRLVSFLVLFVNAAFSYAQTAPCGSKGTVKERIRDCSSQLSSSNNSFVLVSRTKDLKEVYKQNSNSLLWSERLPSAVPYLQAAVTCHGDLAEVAGLNELKWRLPTLEEYKIADKEGVRWSLKNMNYWYWSSSGHDELYNYVWIYSGYDGYIDFANRNYDYVKFSVRCVAK